MATTLFRAVLAAAVFSSIIPVQRASAAPKNLSKRAYESQRVQGDPPVLDGRLSDPVWDSVQWSGSFIQRDPDDGSEPSVDTEFKVVYDDEALYFAFRLYDDPEKVSDLLARRDSFPGDWIEVNIDSYADRRTAFSFTLSYSGTQGDEYISNDGSNWDSSWDAVWNGATQLDSDGWTAEVKIPLSQLRFSDAAEQTWGLQVTRRLFRLEERSTWQHIPKSLSGFVSNFGELRGLRNLKPKRRIEIVPYMVARADAYQAEPGNPFRDGSDSDYDVGIDGKIGITNNLTFDFTVNPDFGQVEADPSEVNLSVFESFFGERRPFFVEGNDIFEMRISPSRAGGGPDNLFYSRRIGRRPGFSPSVPDGGFLDSPANTTILGAFKLSGKTANGLSVGIMESVTAEEEGTIDLFGERSKVTVEPLTSYFAARLRQDFRGGDTQVGGMLTAVNRQLEGELLDAMRSDAYTAGLDVSHYFHDRDYRFEASVFGSNIQGSRQVILDAQQSSARYYQRPDNDYATLDPNRTSLSGHAGAARLTRTNNHQLVFQTGFSWRSPGFEINDLGFMRSADRINQFVWVAYQQRDPVGIFNNWNANISQELNWDYGGNFQSAEWDASVFAEFRNRYRARVAVSRNGERVSNTELRGGPSSKWPGTWSYSLWGGTDERKDFAIRLGTWRRHGDEDQVENEDYWGAITWRPNDALRLTLRPSWRRGYREMQYLGTDALGNEARYLFGAIDQETRILTVRLDYAITQNLTVQLYASPFVSNGRYSEIKRITDSRAADYRDRFGVLDPGQIAFDPVADAFNVDENRDGVEDYSVGNPDFDFREYNSNLVVRWEYQTGSAVFFVWSQLRDETTLFNDGQGYRDELDQLFGAPAQDVFLVKFSRWFSR